MAFKKIITEAMIRFISIKEDMINLHSSTKNSEISFSTMTASAVVVEIEINMGKFKGLGFSSYGRYGHGGLLKERFIPRLLNARPEEFENAGGVRALIANIWDFLMEDEKGGGHGERSGAVGVLETAIWDAFAKSEGLPLWALLEREFSHIKDGLSAPGETIIYASGGHYQKDQTSRSTDLIANEAENVLDAGYRIFKIKGGSLSQNHDEARIEKVISIMGDSKHVAVDLNGTFGDDTKLSRLLLLDKMGLCWIEEPSPPLDYHNLAILNNTLSTPIATGENIFSYDDVVNLLRYGGLRPGSSILQMDIILGYGFTEFVRMIEIAESFGFSRRDFFPHAGHQFGLHASAGLGLGGHEVASVVDGPFGGVSIDTNIQNGIATLSDEPGAGIENKPSLYKHFSRLLE
ncbi:MAG: enolase C-terminal domain-like protein [Pseudomonadota bacterium]|nr:enolase C-terminal domain-like protein [Pseudomonadota bacterium]